MAYFTGPLLERKVQEYALEELDTKLAAIAAGTDDSWPTGGFLFPASPEIIEATRIVLYSVLHSHGLKDRFIVRVRYATNMISVDMKNAPGQQKRVRAMYTDSFSPATTGHFSSPSFSEVPAVSENLDDLFREDITLDTPVGAAVAHNGTSGKEEA